MADFIYVIIANEGSEYSGYSRNLCVVLDEESAIKETKRYEDNIRKLIDIRTSKGRSMALHGRLVKEGQKIDPGLTDLDVDYEYEVIELR